MCKSGIVDQDLEMRGFPTNSQHKTTVRGKWIICSEDLLLAPIWVVPRVENHRSVAFVEAWVNMQSYIRMGVHLTALLQIYVKPAGLKFHSSVDLDFVAQLERTVEQRVER